MVVQTSHGAGPALTRMREATAGAHQALEAALNVMETDLPRYRELIADFWGFYHPLEQQAACYSERGWLDDADRRKAPLLRADLLSLGWNDTSIDALPICTRLPPLSDTAEQLGCMYVIEGSTLGGQHISRRLLPELGLSSERGGRFFSSYGQFVGLRWRELLKQLEARLPSVAMREAAAENALQTFQRLTEWLTRDVRG